MIHNHEHKAHRIGWLRAAVLGANDGIISTSSLILGITAANMGRDDIVLVGFAGLTAGALSMAAGEYVSVSSQADIEKAEIKREEKHLREHPEFEMQELADIYVKRGLEPELAKEVSKQLMEHDALGAHLQEELGIIEDQANPLQAAFASAVSFTLGGLLPLGVLFVPGFEPSKTISISTLLFLFLMGGMAAHMGGANIYRGGLRVMLWGGIAMALTSLLGSLIGHSV